MSDVKLRDLLDRWASCDKERVEDRGGGVYYFFVQPWVHGFSLTLSQCQAVDYWYRTSAMLAKFCLDALNKEGVSYEIWYGNNKWVMTARHDGCSLRDLTEAELLGNEDLALTALDILVEFMESKRAESMDRWAA